MLVYLFYFSIGEFYFKMKKLYLMPFKFQFCDRLRIYIFKKKNWFNFSEAG